MSNDTDMWALSYDRHRTTPTATRRAIVTKWGPAIGWRVKLMADQSLVRTEDTLTHWGAMRLARRFERTGR